MHVNAHCKHIRAPFFILKIHDNKYIHVCILSAISNYLLYVMHHDMKNRHEGYGSGSRRVILLAASLP